DGARGVVRVSDYADLVAGKDDARIYNGYIACLLWMVPFILRGIGEERIEFVFERQKQYENAVNLVMALYADPTNRLDGEEYRFTAKGEPKVARWAFVSKGTTVMTDPADYLAFALHELHSNPGSQKTEWCMPIFAGNSGYGRTIPRETVRRLVERAQQMNR